eukprot:1313040-Prymnesium_polylepis.1
MSRDERAEPPGCGGGGVADRGGVAEGVCVSEPPSEPGCDTGGGSQSCVSWTGRTGCGCGGC